MPTLLSAIITPSNVLTATNTQTVTNKTISGASNTLSNVNLATQVTGNLPVANLNSGTSASASTFWRGDGSWSTPAGGGTVTSVSALTLGTTGTDLGSTVANGTTTPVITLNVPTASATNRGALSSTDWTTFNNKGSGTITSVTGTAPVVSSGGTTPAISMAAATASVNGYLTSTDWTTFNGKGSGTVTSVTGTAPVVSSGGATPAISMAAATASVNGYLTSTDWTTFNGKGAGTVTSVAATVPSVFSITGSPITASGTLAISYSGTALPILNGGTGQTTAGAAFNALSPITTTGDLIIGNGTNTATRLAIGTSTHVLTSNGTTATWAAASGGGVSTGKAFIVSMVFGG